MSEKQGNSKKSPDQGKLLKGIDIWSGAAQSVVGLIKGLKIRDGI